MRPSFRTRIAGLAPSRAGWLQLGACAVLAWSWLRGEPQLVAPLQPLSEIDDVLLQAPVSAGGKSTASGLDLARQDIDASRAVGLGLSTIEVIVSHNDTLDRIFRRLELNLSDLASLRSLPGLKAQLDRLRPGESLKLFARDGQLFGLERRLDPENLLKVVKAGAGFQADVLANPLESRTRTVTGTIDSSLFEAVTSAGAHDPTALAIADIFGWDIDFVLDIQRGDTFTITYQEYLQDGEYVKDGPVLAAKFVNRGREYVAVRYVNPDGQAGYYSPDGRRLRKAFLRAPLEFTRVSSGFNLARRHPVLNMIRAHKGVDYAAPTGTPVRAAGDGRVAFIGRRGGYGNLVELDHARGVSTAYGHLSRFARGVREGMRVSQGQLIGYVGMTGLASGPHLHYEYRINGIHKDPQSIKLPAAAEPLEERFRQDFYAKATLALESLRAPMGVALLAR